MEIKRSPPEIKIKKSSYRTYLLQISYLKWNLLGLATFLLPPSLSLSHSLLPSLPFSLHSSFLLPYSAPSPILPTSFPPFHSFLLLFFHLYTLLTWEPLQRPLMYVHHIISCNHPADTLWSCKSNKFPAQVHQFLLLSPQPPISMPPGIRTCPGLWGGRTLGFHFMHAAALEVDGIQINIAFKLAQVQGLLSQNKMRHFHENKKRIWQ